MSNALTALSPEYWSKRMQVVRFKMPVYRAVANFEERALLKRGDTVHRVFRTGLRVVDYTKGTALTAQDLTATDETLTVDQSKAILFYVDRIDELQNDYATANLFADDAGSLLEEYLDGDFLAEVANADYTVDDGDMGGTAGTAVVPSTSNVAKIFAAASKKLNRGNIPMKDRYAVISPTLHQILIEKLDGKDSSLGDTTGMNGHVGKYMGFDLHVSNNLYWTGRWTPANNPTANDTLTVAGVTFTFVATPTNPGDIDIGASTAVTLDNVLLALTGTGTPGTSTYIEVSEANRKRLTGLAVTDGTTYVDLAFQGGGEVAVSNSDATDIWSLEVVHCMFGQKGAVDVVVQEDFDVKFKDVPDKNGKNVLSFVLYGIKTFDEGDAMLVDVKLDSSGF